MNHSHKIIPSLIYTALIGMSAIFLSGCLNLSNEATPSAPVSWCDKPLRPELKALPEIKTKRKWFKVYKAGTDVYAIAEPYNYQEVISYLILGKSKALLFDTGMGLDSISPLVRELTGLPVTVLNSHTHYDHVGGNYEFNDILGMNTNFTRKNASNGYKHSAVRSEVAPDAFCLPCLPKTDTAHYFIKPFQISKFIGDGYLIDLGGRQLQVIAAPGHTPDAVALLDKQNGYLWSGDSFYLGPSWLFDEGTDLAAYKKSIGALAALAPGLKMVFPSHNTPGADPHLLVEANKAFMEIEKGKVKGTVNPDKTVLFKFDKFSFLIRQDLLNGK